MSPAKANTQAIPSKEQVEMIRSAIQTSLGGLLTALFKKEHLRRSETVPTRRGLD